jgi:hypothetical protein
LASPTLRFVRRPALLAAALAVALLVASCAAAGPAQPAATGGVIPAASTTPEVAAGLASPATPVTLTVQVATGTPSMTASIVISTGAPPGALPEAGASPTPLAAGATATMPATCRPTEPDQLGPFYKPNAPERSSVGQGHVLSGVVRSSVDCSPIAGARIELWMANPNAEYDDAHRATVFSDASGAYRFESNVPVPYTGRPPHIHIKATAEGYGQLITQYYPPAGSTSGTFDLVLIPSQ